MKQVLIVWSLVFLITIPAAGIFTVHPAAAAAHRQGTDNIAVFWVSGNELRALNLVCINHYSRQIAIVSIPVLTLMNTTGNGVTVSELYSQKGMTVVMNVLGSRINRPVNKYILVSQPGLVKISRCIGSISVMGRETTLHDVFEGNYTDAPVDLQAEIRSLAAGLLKPAAVAHLPEVLMVFITEFKTNAGLGDFLCIYQFVSTGGPRVIKKNRLPGTPGRMGSRQVWLVETQTWEGAVKRIMRQE